jgi:PAS domain S-box-containing protein
VTERKQAEETLRAVSQRFRLLAEAVPEKIFSSDATGEVDYCNRRLLEYAGLENCSQWKWKDFVHASDVMETLRRWQLTIASGEPFQHEHRLKGADGVYRWHLSRGHAMPSESEGAWVCIGCCTDIEDQKQQEVRLEEAVVARTAALRETIEELEAFSYSISHDMRQPLRAIEGYAQALLEDHGSNLDPNACAYLDRIRLSAVRLDQLIQDVLSYSRVSRRNIELTNLDLSRVVRETIDTYMPLRGIEIQIVNPLGNVLGHEVALIQCLSNIMGNAVKFAAPRRKLKVKLWSENRPAGVVRLWIEDNGIGIRERDHRRIFDMFVQVHDRERYTGTGIGLTIVRKAIERMRGRVGVHSTFGKGSRFWIELPSA